MKRIKVNKGNCLNVFDLCLNVNLLANLLGLKEVLTLFIRTEIIKNFGPIKLEMQMDFLKR